VAAPQIIAIPVSALEDAEASLVTLRYMVPVDDVHVAAAFLS
jgi:hypothetical protein